MAVSSFSRKLGFCPSFDSELSLSLLKLLSRPKSLASAKPVSFQHQDLKHFRAFSSLSPSFLTLFSSRSYNFSPPTRRFPQALRFYRYSARGFVRWFSGSSPGITPRVKPGSSASISDATPKKLSGIIESIISGENGIGSKFYSMEERLSCSEVIEILLVLNSTRTSALPFFEWIRRCQPEFSRTSDICNLVIDNCGRLGDFDTMLCLLNDFNRNDVRLTQKAFQFLPIVVSSEAKNSVKKVVQLLNEVGGSCLSSGITALITMLSASNSCELAQFILRNTQRKVSYYRILINQMCARCDFEGVTGMLDEMRSMGCDPDIKTYNYILSCLCKHSKIPEAWKLIQEMQERDCAPNALTFEILICYLLQLGKLDPATVLLDIMESKGIEPRLGTHSAFIKCYFNCGNYKTAYQYVVSSSSKYKPSSNMLYSLLARLHKKKGDLVTAHNVLSEMIEKGLRPNFPGYRRFLRCLQESGRDDLASSLDNNFRSISLESNASTDCG